MGGTALGFYRCRRLLISVGRKKGGIFGEKNDKFNNNASHTIEASNILNCNVLHSFLFNSTSDKKNKLITLPSPIENKKADTSRRVSTLKTQT